MPANSDVETGQEGNWTYRSFINGPGLMAGDAQKALVLIFGEAIFTFSLKKGGLTGSLDMGGGYTLDRTGQVQSGNGTSPLSLEIAGIGRAGTPTAGWEYDYRGFLTYPWPNSVNQVDAIAGSVVRAKPHDGAPTGFTASFIAVRRPQVKHSRH